MRIIVILTCVFSLSFTSLVQAESPHIIAHVPEIGNLLQSGADQEQVQDVILKQLLKQFDIHTAQEYLSFLEKNITYKTDAVDTWSSPLQTLVRRSGDCEDLAFLTTAVLKYFGYQPVVVGFKRPQEAHVFVFVEINGTHYIVDNTKTYKTNVHTLDDVARFLHQKYKIEFLVEVRRAPNQIRLMYSKNQLLKLVKS